MSDHFNAYGVFGAAFTAVAAIGLGPVRWAIRPAAGKGRRQVRAVLTDATLADQLLGPWELEHPDGTAVATDWRDCLRCGVATVGVVYGDGTWTCGQCVPGLVGGA